jgi:hypothetical protein
MAGRPWLAALAAFSTLPLACALFSPILTQSQPTPQTGLTPSPSDQRASSTPVFLLTYVSEQGHFLIQYPQGFNIYVGERPSVDGVIVASPNSISILSSTSPNYLLTIELFPLARTGSLIEFVSDTPCIPDRALGQQLTVANEMALFYPQTTCGPYGSSLLFLLHGEDGYLITIESHNPYEHIAGSVMNVLSTLQWTADQ